MAGKAHLTAIARSKPSQPATWLVANGWIKWGDRVLDYGCGKGADLDWLGADGYDPYHRPFPPTGPYDVITCTFVANVLNREERVALLDSIRGLLRDTGVAYISVRRDLKRDGFTSRGTYQENVFLDKEFPGVTLKYERKGAYAIYALRRQ